MTQTQLEERLSRWYVAEVASSPVPPTLRGVLDEIGTDPAIRRRQAARLSPILVAAILLAVALAGATAVIGSQVFRPDRSRLVVLDPATLDPCAVLPGPGPSSALPARAHSAPASVGGDACGYGWDAGGNVHLQLRDKPTDDGAANRIAGELFVQTGETAPTQVLIEGNPAWIGQASWAVPTASGERRDECAAMAVSADPYFFVVWLTCRPNLPPRSAVDWDGYREDLLAIGSGVVRNLDALNDGRVPPYRLEHGRRSDYGWDP